MEHAEVAVIGGGGSRAYRSPAASSGKRVAAVGAGNCAVQMAAELARESRTAPGTRAPVKATRQHPPGRDPHFRPTRTGLDAAPVGRLPRTPPGRPPGPRVRPLPLWFDMCQHRRMSNAKVLPLLEPEAVAPCCPPLNERPLSADEAEVAAKMFKALGDPVRLRLFSAVASHEGGEACVCDISDVGVSQPTVSHHLKKLKEAGLLSSERRGTWVYYRVEPSVLAAMGALLAGAAKAA